jgi:hypothetical protein
VIQVDVRARDCVDDSDPRESRRRRRKNEIADEGDAARNEQRRSDERKGSRPTTMEPEQVAARDRQMQRQIEEAECSHESRDRLRSLLHVAFDEEMKRPLERDDVVRVT